MDEATLVPKILKWGYHINIINIIMKLEMMMKIDAIVAICNAF